jgi:hypothetical protein
LPKLYEVLVLSLKTTQPKSVAFLRQEMRPIYFLTLNQMDQLQPSETSSAHVSSDAAQTESQPRQKEQMPVTQAGQVLTSIPGTPSKPSFFRRFFGWSKKNRSWPETSLGLTYQYEPLNSRVKYLECKLRDQTVSSNELVK